MSFGYVGFEAGVAHHNRSRWFLHGLQFHKTYPRLMFYLFENSTFGVLVC